MPDKTLSLEGTGLTDEFYEEAKLKNPPLKKGNFPLLPPKSLLKKGDLPRFSDSLKRSFYFLPVPRG